MRRGLPAPHPRSERSIQAVRALGAFVALWATFTAALPSEASDLKAHLKVCTEELERVIQGTEEDRSILLSESCPGLSSALERSPIKPLLDKGLESNTSLNQLRDLHAVLTVYEAPSKETIRFDYDDLQGLLARTLIEAPTPNPSWWQRFFAWLSRVLEQHQASENPWVINFLKWLLPPEWLIQWLFKGAMVLIMVLAISVIVNELRHSKLTAWWRKRRQDRIHAPDKGPSTRPPTWSWKEVVALPPSRQPGALLQFIIHHLVDQGLFPNNFSLTNGEFLRLLHAADPQRAGHFRILVLGAEPVLYGNRSLDQVQLERLVDAADRLRA